MSFRYEGGSFLFTFCRMEKFSRHYFVSMLTIDLRFVQTIILLSQFGFRHHDVLYAIYGMNDGLLPIPLQAYCKIDGLPTDVLINGFLAQNRAVSAPCLSDITLLLVFFLQNVVLYIKLDLVRNK